MAFQGSLKELPLPDIIQLVSVSGKTGVFTLKNGTESGFIYLQDGQIVHAQVGDLVGEEAVYDLAIWPQGEFVFTPGQHSPSSSIQKSNTNLLMEAARRIDEWQVLSKRIPSTRLVPVFTQKSSNTSVSFTPQEWALICKIDERRSIEEIAVGLGVSPFETCKILYGLITSGLVELKEDLSKLHTDRLQRMSVPDLSALADKIHQQARQLVSHPEKAHELMRGLDQKEALADLGSAMDYLRSLPEVGKSHIGSLGFCMGGGLSLQLALSRPDLSGAVMFYGQPDTDPMDLDKAACPVLGLFGADDQGIPAAKIQEMAKELNEVGEGATVKIYPGAGHAFFNETRPSYNAWAAADAWTLTLTFFNARLKE